MDRPIPGNGEPKQRYGIILKPKTTQPKQHNKCSFPFFRKPAGTLFRCECGQVWISYYTVDRFVFGIRFTTNRWVSSTIYAWKLAGGSE